mgnify:CR=1 FL=1
MTFLSVSLLLSVARTPDCLVAVSDGEMIDFARFHREVRITARYLRDAKVHQCALAFDNSYYFSVALFAALYAEAAIILPPNNQAGTLTGIEAQGVAVLRDQSVISICDTTPEHIIFAPEKLKTGKISFYTSGSTGAPKIIHKSLHQIEAEISVLQETWGNETKDCLTAATVSHQHIYGLLFKVLWPLCAGRVFIADPILYWENIRPLAHEKCCLISSPAHLSRFPDQFKFVANIAFSSGGPLSLEAANASEQHLSYRPIEVFGSTETGGIAFRQQTTNTTPWSKFSVVDLAETDGVLRVRSPYLDTAGWYQTNDMVALHSEKEFTLKGRNDRIVKVEGKRVSLIEIEIWIRAHEWIADANVLLLTAGRKPLACVATLTEAGQEKLDSAGAFRFGQMIRQEMHGGFDLAAQPKRWRFVAEIPENTEGKRLHRDLSALFD